MAKQHHSWRQRLNKFFRGKQTDGEWRDTCEVFVACLATLMALASYYVSSGLRSMTSGDRITACPLAWPGLTGGGARSRTIEIGLDSARKRGERVPNLSSEAGT